MGRLCAFSLWSIKTKILNFFTMLTVPTLIKAVIGLCRNLGLGLQNQQYLRDAGAIPKLVDLLFRADSEMKRGVYSENEGNDQKF